MRVGENSDFAVVTAALSKTTASCMMACGGITSLMGMGASDTPLSAAPTEMYSVVSSLLQRGMDQGHCLL
jgi:hypothetical protein